MQSINDETKRNALNKNPMARFFKQFIAGADNPEDMNKISDLVYFFGSRLNRDLNKGNLESILGVNVPFLPNFNIGVGLSHGNRNIVQLSKNFMLKRILPVAIGFTYLDWINDTQREYTGHSSLESIESGYENISLGMRKITDKVGLTSWLKKVKEASPLWQYASGDYTSYQSEQEHREWLQNGYTPVRRGRYWLFGSANEFRGSSISYWQPNHLRRETANAYDISLYGSYDEKWSHSLVPTPGNLLSPLKALFDPYYLERKHYYDRPYPVSGQMFQQGTPWGAVLNPTIGAFFKPVIRMHENRMIGGMDVQAIVN
jgi:hypothetical protein